METSVFQPFSFFLPIFQPLSWILQGSHTCSALTRSPEQEHAVREEKHTHSWAARIPIAQARWISICLPLSRIASSVPRRWETLEWHPRCRWEENQTPIPCKGHNDDGFNCLQTGRLVSSPLSNNEADGRDLHIWKQFGRKLFCSTFTCLPPSAFAVHNTSPAPCSLARA